MSRGPVVVAGAGDVGGRLAARRQACGDEVIALRRSDAESVPGLRRLCADLATGEGLARLPRQARAIVFCAAPDRRDEAAYRALYLDGLRRLMDTCDAERVLFVSSTAVFGEDHGEWVDEDTLARPPGFNGRILLDSEQALANHPAGIALRLSGLYGPGRDWMLRRAREGEPGGARWTNRIHVEDAARALSHLLDVAAPQRLYLGNDDLPALEHEVLAWVRAREGLPSVPRAPGPETGRRVRNARLRASGWVPGHPDYRSGYRGMLASPGV
jgi:electron-transferring-flavoprotein dehydrogenase